MKLASLDGDRLGVVEKDTVYDISAVRPMSLTALIGAGPAALAEVAELRRHAPGRALSQVALGPPVPRPGKIIAAPVNYRQHMAEMSEVRDINALGVFLKASSSVIGPAGTVRLPYHDRRFDHEGELAVVIGRPARNLTEAQALEAVFGYTCLLDMTMRGGEDRSIRKSFDTFTPMGPWVVTADELTDPDRLALRLTVNGTPRQDATTAELIWSVARLVAYASSTMTLYPGDVIATGTPEGVGPVEDGDRVEVTIDGIGALAVDVSAEGATTCPTTGAGQGPVPPPAPAR